MPRCDTEGLYLFKIDPQGVREVVSDGQELSVRSSRRGCDICVRLQ